MPTEKKEYMPHALRLSLAAHAVAAAVMIAAGSRITHKTAAPLRIELITEIGHVFEQPIASDEGRPAKQAGRPALRVRQSPLQKPVGTKETAGASASETMLTTPSSGGTESAAPAAGTLSEPGSAATSNAALTGNGGNGSGAHSPSMGGIGGVPGPSTGSLQRRYLKEHFTYIRDLVTNRLRYPWQAKKMHLTGKVILAFIILEDGTTEHVRIVESSGHEILDENAVAAVGEAQPFPRPPVKAELILPVVYKLD